MSTAPLRTADDGVTVPLAGAKRKPAAGPLLRTFENIASVWGLDQTRRMALLGVDSRSTYANWRRAPDDAPLKRHTVERLSYVFGIYQGLQRLMPRGEGADGWPSRPNSDPPFGGRAPLELMASGLVGDLQRVRAYVDGECQR